MTIALLLLLAALVSFVLAAFGVAARVNLVALGLAFVTLSLIVGGSGATLLHG